MDAPRFTIAETYEAEEYARSTLLNADGALDDPGYWTGVVIDLARALRSEMEMRIDGPCISVSCSHAALSA